MPSREKRTFGDCEIRAENDESGGVTISGYAAVFNTLSQPMWGFREQILPGAFDDVLNDDVRGLFNHDSNFVLGRNGSTMKLSVDHRGLHYEIQAPDTQTVKDMVIEPMRRGDINQSSFAFAVDEDKWEENDEGVVIRSIVKVKRLYDVSPVTYPAYVAADSTLRSFEGVETEKQKQAKESEKRAQDKIWREYVSREIDTL